MTNKSMVESPDTEVMEQFLYHINPDIRKITGGLEKVEKKIINSVPSSLITCFLNIYSSKKKNIYLFLKYPVSVQRQWVWNILYIEYMSKII